MRKMAFVCSVVGALCLMGKVASAQETQGVLGNSVFYLSAGDLGKAWSSVKQTPLYAASQALGQSPVIMASPDWARFLAAKSEMESALGFPLTADSLFGNVIGGGVISFGAEEAGPGRPPLLLTLQINDTEKFGRLFAAMEEHIRRQEGDGPRVAEPYGGGEIVTLGAEGPAAGVASLIGKTFVLSNRKEILKQAIDGSGPDLGEPAGARSAFTHLKSPSPDLRVYMNAAAIRQAAQAEAVGPQARALLGTAVENLLGGVDDAAGALMISPNRLVYESATIIAPASQSVAARSARTAPAKLEILEYAPQGAWFASAMNQLDLALLLQSWRDLMAAQGDADAAAEHQAEVQRIEAFLGASLDRDIAPAIGPQMVIALNSVTPNILMPQASAADISLGMQIRDKAKVRSLLSNLEARIQEQAAGQMGAAAAQSQMAFSEVEHKGAQLRFLSLPGTAMSPGYALDGDYLIFNTTVENLKTAVDIRRNGSGSAAAHPRLAALASEYGHPDANVAVVANLGQMVAQLRQMVMPMAQMALANNPAQLQSLQAVFDTLGSIHDVAHTSRWTGQVVHSANSVTFGGAATPAR